MATLSFFLSLQSERICIMFNSFHTFFYTCCCASERGVARDHHSQWLARLNCDVVRSSKRVGRNWPGLLTVGLISSLAVPLYNQRIHLPFPRFYSPFCCKFPSFLPPWLLNSVPFFPLGSSNTNTHTSSKVLLCSCTHPHRETHQALELGQIQLISQTATSPHHQR